VTYPEGDEPRYEKVSGFEDWERLTTEPIVMPDRFWSASVMHILMEKDGSAADLKLSIQWRERAGPQAILSFEPVVLPNEPDEVFRKVLYYVRRCEIFCPDLFIAHRVASLHMNELCYDPVILLEEFWCRAGPAVVSIRCGRSGSYVWTRESGQVVHIPIVPVETVDVTGAGNAYAGAFASAYGWAKDATLAGCLASAVGAAAVTSRGIPPTSDTLRKWIFEEATKLQSQVQVVSKRKVVARI